jgi:membrane-bound lytic murein transglycosylase B
MRNKLLSAMTLLAITVSPAVTIAEPVTQAKEIDETKIVETIKSVVDTHLDSKDEIATRQIEENLKKIEEERKAAEAAAAEAAKKAAEAKAKATKPVVVKPAAPVDLQALYQAAGAKFGVNPAILAAVHMVETGQSGDTTRASGAGAQGPMQFLASTFRAYAVDGDGDGVANIYDVHDAVFSAAKYLAANGAAAGNVTNALLRYNHSMTYVNHVLAIARGYGYTG